MKRTKETFQEVRNREALDYLEEYYHELLDSQVPVLAKKQIIDKVLGI